MFGPKEGMTLEIPTHVGDLGVQITRQEWEQLKARKVLRKTVLHLGRIGIAYMRRHAFVQAVGSLEDSETDERSPDQWGLGIVCFDRERVSFFLALSDVPQTAKLLKRKGHA